jgi:uncharacterized membrane protein YhhN
MAYLSELVLRYLKFHVPALLIQSVVLLMLLAFFVNVTKLRGRFHKRFFTGMIFMALSDLFFMADVSWFLYALIGFLLGNLFYTRAFYLDFLSAQELDKRVARIAIACCSLGSIAFYLYLRPYLGNMKLPVMVYIFVMAMMLMMSVFRRLRVNEISFNLVFAGALFLAFSDVLLAHFKFVVPLSGSNVFVGAIYMLAQFLLVMGAAERKLLSPTP